MTKILKAIAQEKTKTGQWKNRPDVDRWADTMAKRTRCACRHIQQARLRRPIPAWVHKIFNRSADRDRSETSRRPVEPATPATPEAPKNQDHAQPVSAPAETQAHPPAAPATDEAPVRVQPIARTKATEDSQTTEATQYLVGFYTETTQAWRSDPLGSVSYDMTTDLRICVGEVIARWPDGFEHVLIGVPEESKTQIAAKVENDERMADVSAEEHPPAPPEEEVEAPEAPAQAETKMEAKVVGGTTIHVSWKAISNFCHITFRFKFEFK